VIAGQNGAVEQFRQAWDSRLLHHAWLLAGPRGVGKGHFARAAATRLLAEAAGPAFDAPGLETPAEHPIAKLIEAGSHPDMRLLERLPKEKGEGVVRSITVKQVRELGEFMGLTAALSPWRTVIIDSVDDLEREGANALLKMLEEPPPNTVFFLVSHAPGRLLPTIRSRCRRLDFQPIDSAAMTSVLERILPGTSIAERERLIPLSGGSVGRALAFAELDLAPLEESALSILQCGDPDNSKRSDLAGQLARKGAADRYAAFLELAPSLVAHEARDLPEPQRERALKAYDRIRELTAIAPRLSLDPAATIFQIGGILASVAVPQGAG
jgi:DNA polymerase III subunit delta'